MLQSFILSQIFLFLSKIRDQYIIYFKWLWYLKYPTLKWLKKYDHIGEFVIHKISEFIKATTTDMN